MKILLQIDKRPARKKAENPKQSKIINIFLFTIKKLRTQSKLPLGNTKDEIRILNN
jgi:hypothetical protein